MARAWRTRLTFAALSALAGAAAQPLSSYYCSPGAVVTVTTPNNYITVDASLNPPLPELCTWVVGVPGSLVSVNLTGVAGDPGLSWAAFYDGVGTSPESLLLRIAGGQPGVPQPPLPPTFTTATPFLTIYFYSEPNSYPGLGFAANVTLIPATAAPTPLPPAAAAAGPAVPVSSGAALAAALAAGATAVTLRANVSLAAVGALSLSGAGAALAVTSDATACGEGGCVLDCGGGGRAFLVSAGAALTLTRVGLANCVALQGGAALALGAGSSITTNGGSFYGNLAWGDGGALLALAGGAVSVAGGTWVKNSASSGGALAATFGGTLSVTGAAFAGNYAAGAGGSVFAVNGSTLSVSSSTFVGDVSGGYGGSLAAIYYNTVTYTGITVTAAVSQLDGAGVHFYMNSASAMSNSSVARCLGANPNNAAGQVAVEFQETTLSNVVLSDTPGNGTAAAFGIYNSGCLFMWGGTVYATNLTAARCLAVLGPAVEITTGGMLNCTGCTFRDSIAQSGGGAIQAISGSEVLLTGCTFINNTAASGGGGALMFNSDSTPLTIVGSTFANNSAPTDCGGAVSVQSGSSVVSISDCTFVDNTAASGGALCMPGIYSPYQCQQAVNTASGDIAPFGIGNLVPQQASCSWTLGANLAPGCVVQLQITVLQNEEYADVLTVMDNASGNVLYTFSGVTTQMPQPIVSGPEGMTVLFTANQNPGNYWPTGFAASFATICGNSTSDVTVLKLQNSTLTGNVAATGDGGAVSLDTNAGFVGTRLLQALVAGCTIQGNAAPAGAGGGVSANNSMLTLSGGMVINNAAASNGGGLSVTDTAQLALAGTTVAGNAAGLLGGGVYVSGVESVALSAVTFSANVAGAVTGSGSGGGLVAAACGTVNLTGCTWLQNSAAGMGGGTLVEGCSSLTASGCTWQQNAATGTAARGGGLALTNVPSASLALSTLSGNTVSATAPTPTLGQATTLTYRSGDGGGAFVLNDGSVTANVSVALTATQLSGNAASGGGGALAMWGAVQAKLVACYAFNNSAAAGGGALTLGQGSQALVQAGTLLNNTAGSAAAVVASAVCGQESGTASVSGGAALVQAVGSLTLAGSVVTGNSAQDGGGAVALLSGGALSVQGTSLSGNAAANDGGALMVSGASTASVSNCTVVGNTAFIGGALSLRNVTATAPALLLSALTFENNFAQAGSIYAFADSGQPAQQAPACSQCSSSGNEDASYGTLLATPPAVMQLQASGATVSSGDSLTVVATLLDGFGQLVEDYPQVFVQATCASVAPLPGASAAAAAAACTPSTVRGIVSSRYGDGAATLAPLLLYGVPGAVYTLAISAQQSVAGGPGLRLATASIPFTVTVAPCASGLVFDSAALQCKSAASSNELLSPGSIAAAVILVTVGFAAATVAGLTIMRGRLRSKALKACLIAESDLTVPQLLKRMGSLKAAMAQQPPDDPSPRISDPTGARVTQAAPPRVSGASGALVITISEEGATGADMASGAVTPADSPASPSAPMVEAARRMALREAVGNGAKRVEYRGTRVFLQPIVAAVRAEEIVGLGRRMSSTYTPGESGGPWGTPGAAQARRSAAPMPMSSRLSQWFMTPDATDTATASDEAGDSLHRGASARGFGSARGSTGGGGAAGVARGSSGGGDSGRPRRSNSLSTALTAGGFAGSRSRGRSRSWASTNLQQLCALRHPNIVTTFGATDVFESRCLVEEFLSGGALGALLQLQVLELEPAQKQQIAVDITSGCRYLHEARVPVVAALSSRSILLDGNLQPKVRVPCVPAGQPVTMPPDYWAAPEAILSGTRTPETDVYAFGIILHEIFTREEPFSSALNAMDAMEVLQAIVDTDLRPIWPGTALKGIRNVASDCWHRNPERRPTFAEVSRLLARVEASSGPQPPAAKSSRTGIAMGGMRMLNQLTSTPELVANPAQQTQRKETALLEEVLPRHVVDALKAGRKVEPETHDSVTIFFSDIVGFTDLSAQLEPRQVMDMLDRLYSKLDALVIKYGLFKVETIGDAFMATCGMYSHFGSHTLRVAQFATEAVEAANTVAVDVEDSSKGTLEIRVGFHVGAVVASVVGTVRPRFCLFGDSVNVASRMESNSERGRINMSDAAARALREQSEEVRLVDRGQVNIKGKGAMHCFFLDTSPEARRICLAARAAD